MGTSVRIFGKHLVLHTPCGLLILLLRLHYGFLLAVKMHNRCRHHFHLCSIPWRDYRSIWPSCFLNGYDLPVGWGPSCHVFSCGRHYHGPKKAPSNVIFSCVLMYVQSLLRYWRQFSSHSALLVLSWLPPFVGHVFVRSLKKCPHNQHPQFISQWLELDSHELLLFMRLGSMGVSRKSCWAIYSRFGVVGQLLDSAKTKTKTKTKEARRGYSSVEYW
jgi:hypothetical protein